MDTTRTGEPRGRLAFAMLLAACMLVLAAAASLLLPRTAYADTQEVGTAEELIAAAAQGGTIVLNDEIKLSEELVVSATIVLDLNGHTITSTSTENVIKLKYGSGAQLTIQDHSTEGNGTIKGVGQNIVQGDYDIKMVTIEGGDLILDSTASYARGVNITRGEGFTITGGSIKVTGPGTAWGGSFAGCA